MSTQGDPLRMVDAEGTPAELCDLLQQASQDVLSPAAVDRVATGVAAQIVGPAGPAGPSIAPPAAASGLTGSTLGSLLPTSTTSKVGAALIVAAAAGGWWLFGQPDSAVDAPNVPAASASVGSEASPQAMPSAGSGAATGEGPAAEPSAQDDEPGAAQAGATGKAGPSTAVPPSSSKGADGEADPPAGDTQASMLAEHRLLRSARAALQSDPQGALALTQEHKRRFPKGMLTQEREVIAIEALQRMGRSGAASSRADQFNQQYPDSPHRDRVDGSGGASGR